MNSLLRTPPAEGLYPPPLLLAAIRSIDPNVDLIHVGGGHWWLGSVKPNTYREGQGRQILMFEEKRGPRANPRNIMLGRLLLEGFARINGYVATGAVDGLVVPYDNVDTDGAKTTILEDFKERHFNSQSPDGGERVFRERLEHANGEAAKREAKILFREYMVNDGRSHFRRETKDRKSFGYGGVTGGRIITLS